MAKGLKSISANNKLSYYTNEKNIPNQELVKVSRPEIACHLNCSGHGKIEKEVPVFCN